MEGFIVEIGSELAAAMPENNIEAVITENNTEVQLVIGDENCTCFEIIQCLLLHNSTKISCKLREVAFGLNLSRDLIEKLSLQIAQGTYNSTLSLFEILEEFRSKYATEATLNKFIKVLIQYNLNREAALLGDKFMVPVDVSWQSPETRASKSVFPTLAVAVTKVVLLVVVVVATCLIPYLNKKDNTLTDCPLTSMKSDDVNRTVHEWAKIIQIANCSNIHNILSNCLYSNSTRDFLSDTVKAAYNGSLKRFTNVLRFVREIDCPWYQYTGFLALRTTMSTSGHDHTIEMMKLVYFIKLIMENGYTGSDLDKKYSDLKDVVPNKIRRIIFRECVLIKNSLTEEYMYLTRLTANSQKLVMTWKGYFKSFKRSNDARSWYFDVDYKDNKLTFEIRNAAHDSPLVCYGPNRYDSNRLKVGTCLGEEKNNFKWIVTPWENSENNIYFTIKSKTEYHLYSPDNSYIYSRIYPYRYTFAWTGTTENISKKLQFYWDISSCPYKSELF